MTSTGDAKRRAEVVRAAQALRAEARRVSAETVAVLQQSRRLGELVTQRDTGGTAGRTAFSALPTPAALLDHVGRIVAVNPAWRESPAVRDELRVGASFGEVWTNLTDDPFVGDALDTVLCTSTPMQVEVTLSEPPAQRFLVQLGPAMLPGGVGALVILTDLTPQYEREQQLMHDATHDVLTGVANRAWLQHALRDALERLRRYGERFALIYLDLDAFKPLNDRYGHAAGDDVLRGVAARWTELVRRPDLLARVGGDEFVVLVWRVVNLDSVAALARRLSAALDEPFVVHDALIALTVTVGVAVPPAELNTDDAIALADQAMYQQKRARRTGEAGS